MQLICQKLAAQHQMRLVVGQDILWLAQQHYCRQRSRPRRCMRRPRPCEMTRPREVLAKVAVRAQVWDSPLSVWQRLGDVEAFAVITHNAVLVAVIFAIPE